MNIGDWINDHLLLAQVAEIGVFLLLGLSWVWLGHRRLPASHRWAMSGYMLELAGLLSLVLTLVLARFTPDSFWQTIVICYLLYGVAIAGCFLASRKLKRREYERDQAEAIHKYGSVDQAIKAVAKEFTERVTRQIAKEGRAITMVSLSDSPLVWSHFTEFYAEVSDQLAQRCIVLTPQSGQYSAWFRLEKVAFPGCE